MTNTRVERFERDGYKTIHLFGHWYLVRNWSVRNPRWYARIPIYLLTYLPRMRDMLSVMTTPHLLRLTRAS